MREHNLDARDYFAVDPEASRNRHSLASAFGGNPLNKPKLPMQYVPAPTALYLAGALGCRLPTSAEWAAAYARPAPNARWNLRDEIWQRQLEYVAKAAPGKAPGQPEWPDAGAFIPKDAKVAIQQNARWFKTRDDVLWFREVDVDDGHDFHNLVGNVAEFVWDDPRAFETLADKSLASVRKLIEQHADELHVIGGSALSAPELKFDQPLPVDLAETGNVPSAWNGYADVGMRLAFSAPGTRPQRLGWIVAAHPYLSRAASAPTTAPPATSRPRG